MMKAPHPCSQRVTLCGLYRHVSLCCKVWVLVTEPVYVRLASGVPQFFQLGLQIPLARRSTGDLLLTYKLKLGHRECIRASLLNEHAPDAQFLNHVPHDARGWAKLGRSDASTVDWAR